MKRVISLALLIAVTVTCVALWAGGETEGKAQAGAAGAKATTAKGKELPTLYATLADYEKATGKKIGSFGEAPALKQLVASGKLPPVAQRISDEPMVIEPLEEIGKYGGTLRRSWLGPADSSGVQRMYWEPFTRFDPKNMDILPQVPKRYEVSADMSTYTFYLRKGMKWSDGQPFNADDVMFFYEDVMLNKELTPVVPTALLFEGKPVRVEKVDDYTVKLSFPKPYPFFLIAFTQNAGIELYAPKHYLKQFHPRYVPQEELNKKAKDAGFNTWVQYYLDKSQHAHNPALPTVRAWNIKSAADSPIVVFDRNPYYWVVDTAGNQLPYIDNLSCSLSSNTEMVTMKGVNGEVDFQARHIQLKNYTLLKKNEERGGYRVALWSGDTTMPVIFFSQSYRGDAFMESLLHSDKFRKALSLAINRQEINEISFLGLGKIRQASLLSSDRYYDAEWESEYTAYEPAKAAAMLDEVGLKKGPDGFRLRPDGARFDVLLEITDTGLFAADTVELVRKNWEAVGVKTNIKTMDRSVYTQRNQSNALAISVYSCGSFFYSELRKLHSQLPGRRLLVQRPCAVAAHKWRKRCRSRG